MKRAFRILLLVVAVILVLNIALVALLSNKSVQGKLISYGENWLKEKTGTELSIGYIGFDLFNGVFAEDLYVEDLSGDTLVYAKALKVDVGLRALLNTDHLKIKQVELDDFVVHIDKASDSTDFNYQFLIDSFASKEPKEEKSDPFELKINNIVLRNGYLTYDVQDAPMTLDTFNASHISCRNLQLEASLEMAQDGEITAEVEQLSFEEQSGLRVTGMEAEMNLKEHHLRLPHFSMTMPKSEVRLEADCDLDALAYEVKLQTDTFSLSDLRCFMPEMATMSDSFSLSLEASGELPTLYLKDVKLDYPSMVQINAPWVKMDDLQSWEIAEYDVKVDQLALSQKFVDRLFDLLGKEKNETLADYMPVQSQLRFKGTLPKGDLSLNVKVPQGEVDVDGSLSYKHEEKYLGCDLAARCKDIALDAMLKSDDFKPLSMISNAKMDWRMEQLPDVKLDARVLDFSYRGYSYDTLNVIAHYFTNDSLSSHAEIRDPNLGVMAWLGGGELTGEKPRLSLNALVDHFSPAKTHIADSLGDAMIRVALSANVNDLNDLLGDVAIDSLYLRRDSSEIHWDKPSVARHIALADGTRQLNFSSPALDAELKGTYDFADFYPACIQVLRSYWPDLLANVEVEEPTVADRFQFAVKVKDVADLTRFIGQDIGMPMGATLDGNLAVTDHLMKMNISVPSLSLGKRMVRDVAVKMDADGEKLGLDVDVVADTSASGASELLRVTLKSSVADNRMAGEVEAVTFPDSSFVKGSLPFTIYSNRVDTTGRVNMNLTTKRADWTLMGYRFGITPAEIHQLADKILVKNIGVTFDDNVLLSVEGVASDLLTDTLNIRFDRVNLEPIVGALARRHIPLQCTMDGDLHAMALMGEKMRFQTNNLRFDTIVYEGIHLGDLAVNMRWNNERKGVLSKMILTNDGKQVALVQGVVKPVENRLKMVTSLDSLPLDIFSPFTADYVSDTRGNIGANILVEGEFDDLSIEGTLLFKDVHMKVNYTGVGYTISDTIRFERNRLRLGSFSIKDDNGNRMTLKGDVSHEKFKRFNYDLQMNMDNFLLLNNPKARANTLYGLFYANAKNVTVKGTDTHMKVRGEFSNGDKTTLNIVLPETVTEVQTYDNIVYVKPAEAEEDTASKVVHEVPLDIDADLLVKLTDQATFYVNVADGTMINGNGNLRVVYNEGNVSLYNRYTVNNGYVKIKLSEIPAKKFTIQEGAYVQFNGDPMKLQFDATACYDLTADLATLSKGFVGMGLSSTRQPVRCSAQASGSLSEMNLTYDITLPKSADNVVNQLNSVISTDDIRIREFAYLIGLGMFYAPNEQAQGDEMLTSLASSSLSAALNNALSSVLKDKVTIGTGFSSSDEDFSDVEMNLSVSTKLFNDRLLLSTNLGYQKQATEEDNQASFLGDFDAEYLLGKKKVLRVKAYNHTNNDYYRASSNTQGVGVVFVKESKTLRGLLPFGKDEEGRNLLAPRDTTVVKERRTKHEKE